MTTSGLKLGWAEVDITPTRPVPLAGSFDTRISEGVRDPLSATAWAVEGGADHAVFVSCDLLAISDELRDAVRAHLKADEAGLDPMKVLLHATHTHTAPENRPSSTLIYGSSAGVELREIHANVMSVEEYVAFASERVAEAVHQAWASRSAGGIGYGMGYAVIGRNRRWIDAQGRGTMHGLNESTADRFRHIEGYEDHSLNIIATYDGDNRLTGLVVNLACTAQVPGESHPYLIGADVWYEARRELRSRFGDSIFILPQCSAAGDQTGHIQFDKQAESRMLRLQGRNKRQDVAHQIANAIEEILPAVSREVDTALPLRHLVEAVNLTANLLTEEDVRLAEQEAQEWEVQYERGKEKLAQQPELRQNPRWYKSLTQAYRRMLWHRNVVSRYEQQKQQPTLPAEIHVLRLGDMALASVPYEYYLDYGIQIKARSPATQTFLIQLAGSGTYVPSPRSLLGGGYGSTPASNPVGAEGGQELAEHLVREIRSLWT